MQLFLVQRLWSNSCLCPSMPQFVASFWLGHKLALSLTLNLRDGDGERERERWPWESCLCPVSADAAVPLTWSKEASDQRGSCWAQRAERSAKAVAAIAAPSLFWCRESVGFDGPQNSLILRALGGYSILQGHSAQWLAFEIAWTWCRHWHLGQFGLSSFNFIGWRRNWRLWRWSIN